MKSNMITTIRHKCMKFVFVALMLSFYDQGFTQIPDLTFRSLEEQFERIEIINLSDFSPEEFQLIRNKLIDLRKKVDKGGELPDSTRFALQTEIKNFEVTATKTSKYLRKAYELRQIANENDFIRAHSPILLYKANEKYMEARLSAKVMDYRQSKIYSKQAEREYDFLIEAAQSKIADQYKPILENYREIVKNDLKALKAQPNHSAEVELANSITERVNLENFGIGNRPDGLLDPGYFPPPSPLPGPTPPDGVGIEARFSDAIRIFWYDKSDDETGNLVVRYSNSSSEQITLANLGPLRKFEKQVYTDTFDIQPETRYCYQIVSYNDAGARPTRHPTCIISGSSEKIPVFRLRARITVDDASQAGCDCTLGISLGQDIAGFGSHTYLDYSHDDFERGSVFTYDLNMENIKNLFDITEIRIDNIQDNTNEEDKVKISKIEFFANWKNDIRNGGEDDSNTDERHKFFEKDWEGDSKWMGGATFGLEEIRNNPSWLRYLVDFEASKINIIPTKFPVHFADDGTEILIKKEEIVSRIESIVGHNGEKGIQQQTNHGIENINFGWKDEFGSDDITVENDTTIKISLHLDPYNLGEAHDSRLVAFIKEAAVGPFKIEAQIAFSLRLDTLLDIKDTIIDNRSLRDTTIIFMLGGFIKLDKIEIDGRPSIGATIVTALIFKGKGLAAFAADPIFDFVADCLVLDDIPKTIEKKFDPPIEIGRVRKKSLEGISFDPDEIRVFFDQNGDLHVCCFLLDLG